MTAGMPHRLLTGPRSNGGEGGGEHVRQWDINNVESSGPSRLAATAEASTRLLPSGDVEAGAVFESGSYCCVGLKGGISAGGHGAW